jgi:serine/threonine protein kinase
MTRPKKNPDLANNDPVELDATFESQAPKSIDDPIDETIDSQVSAQKIKASPEQTLDSQTSHSIRRSQNRARDENEMTIASQAANDHGSLDEFSVDETQNREGLPECIGRYKVRRMLGEGAFGQVFEALDPQLDRLVAVKVAKSISGSSQVQRFLREARSAAKLRHPNIIPVYEYGPFDGQNIIVYEYVAGETLKAYLKRKGILEIQEAVRIIREIAEGLGYAHSEKIIHRDVKPDNILIDSNGKPHIADFGCARSIDDQTNLTIDGSIMGTPMYMSPEQASGKSSLADGRTDVWSLGVMLYELVSGKRPFYGQLSDLLFWIRNDDAKPLRKISPTAPVDIETICAKCMTREIDGRFETATELAEELARFERGEPIQSRRVSTLKRTWMWAKRNQAIASLLATVAATLLIGIIVSSTFAYQAYRERQRRVTAQIESLVTSEASELPSIIESLSLSRQAVVPKLKERMRTGESADEKHSDGNLQSFSIEQRRIMMALVTLDVESDQRNKIADSLSQSLLSSGPDEFWVCRQSLVFRAEDLKEGLWETATDLTASSQQRFRACAALALYDPESKAWNSVDSMIANELTKMNEVEMADWIRCIIPIREQLKPMLVDSFRSHDDGQQPVSTKAASVIVRLFQDQPELIASLVPDSTPEQLPYLIGALKSNAAVATELLDSDDLSSPGIANRAISLVQLGLVEKWDTLQNSNDRSAAAEMIARIGPASTPFELVFGQISKWKSIEPSVLAGMLLSLGEFRSNQILQSQKKAIQPAILEIFSSHPDSYVHSSARWILQHWEFEDELIAAEKKLRKSSPDPDKNWHVDLSGNTFAIFGPVDQFEMGLKPDESGIVLDVNNEPLHQKQLPRRFGICIHEVTIRDFEQYESSVAEILKIRVAKLDAAFEQFKKSEPTAIGEGEKVSDQDAKAIKEFRSKSKQFQRAIDRLGHKIKNIDRLQKRRQSADRSSPVSDVDFYSSLGFCRWLSEQNKTEFSLPKIETIIEAYDGLSDFYIGNQEIDRKGYRLPTASEWEYACRYQTQTAFPFGSQTRLAKHYAWFANNSDAKLHSVGSLKPNHAGMFDMLGNVSEWCLDWYDEKLPSLKGLERAYYVDFGPEFGKQRQSLNREYRGGSYLDEITRVRSSKRFFDRPNHGQPRLGFRIARTY